MKLFITIFATIGIFVLSVSLSLCAFIVVADETKIGKAIRDYIYSKIVERNKDE